MPRTRTPELMSTNSQPVTLAISGMSCGHCVAAVKSALEAAPGVVVQNVAVGSATIALDPATTPDVALEAIREAGYSAQIAPAGSKSMPILG